jgi:nitric oxide reductase large subunit
MENTTWIRIGSGIIFVILLFILIQRRRNRVR